MRRERVDERVFVVTTWVLSLGELDCVAPARPSLTTVRG